jgi:hypothetical protein
MKMSETLNKSILDFCKNKFTGDDENHCAHFVCHVLEIDSGFDCKTHMNGNNPGASIRVHELFSECPDVGEWENAPQGIKIIFVTDRSNVDLNFHTMRNVPKKHVGIFSDGLVYHYSNTQDIVVRQSPEDFFLRFKKIYGGEQGLYYGTMPLSAKLPDSESKTTTSIDMVNIATEPKPVIRKVKVSEDKFDYFATLYKDPEYYVARSVSYESYKGLYQPHSKFNGPRFMPSDYVNEYGSVAGMLAVISTSESEGYFNRLNTYDRASFTFGFFQLAAHTPNDNLILLFRRAIQDSSTFRTLFPNLLLVNGILYRKLGPHSVSLENQYPRPGYQNEQILKDFMSYLNPDVNNIDDTELSIAARIVQLANTDVSFNHIQVNVAAQITMRKLRDLYSIWYKLNGVSDVICTAIADIHHQGRGTKSEIRNVLSSTASFDDKVNALCMIGHDKYLPRCKSLKAALKKAMADGFLGVSKFDSASGLFKADQG